MKLRQGVRRSKRESIKPPRLVEGDVDVYSGRKRSSGRGEDYALRKRKTVEFGENGQVGEVRRRFRGASDDTAQLARQQGKRSVEKKPVVRKDKKSHGTVVIIGAGMSGLAAARELEHRGFKVIVLEARDRIGGRAWTHTFESGAFADLGASNIHGIQDNPVAIIAKRLGKTLHSQQSNILYDWDGKAMNKDDDVKAEVIFNSALERAYVKRPSSKNKKKYRRSRRLDGLSPPSPAVATAAPVPTVSAEKPQEVENREEEKQADQTGKSLERALQDELQAYSLNETQMRAVNWHLSHLEYSLNTDLDQVNNEDWDEDDDYAFDGEHCMVSGGIQGVAEGMASDLDVRLNSVVKRVSYFDDKVNIEVSGGSTIHADICLVTVPLGVLKAGKIEFSPRLPKQKEESIERLGFGVLDKVALVFPKVFWDPSTFVGYASKLRGEFPLIFDGSRICKRGGVLLALISGRLAEEKCERPSDEQVVGGVMSILRRIFGEDIEDPIESHVTRWKQDPYTLGSYSFVSLNSSGGDYDVFAAPVAARPCHRRKSQFRLFFAGEGTNRFYPATLHGAFLSGIREARKISTLFHTNGAHPPPVGLDCLKKIGAEASECSRLAIPKKLRRPVEHLTEIQIRRDIIHNFTFPIAHFGSPASLVTDDVGLVVNTGPSTNLGGLEKGQKYRIGKDVGVITYLNAIDNTAEVFFDKLKKLKVVKLTDTDTDVFK